MLSTRQSDRSPARLALCFTQGIVSFLRRCDTRIRHVVAADEDKFALWTTYAFAPEGGSTPPPERMPGSHRAASAADEARLQRLVDHDARVAGSGGHVTCVSLQEMVTRVAHRPADGV